ncbi:MULTISPECIES: heparan-alpha-glucosaminide N-acetyltransferase [Mesorhizobium]|uniref:DUF1624 domain-containing protein n=1 Tax=Mesorhizobium denitrificans TaxID=2294114 RepID=A0A371XFT7_9HYPH|nr:MULTISPECIES: DUF1624 domain-containing protein [Mesorhizobium]RFC68089.1 DUF1624 domain-containing protein [Mesorhizobium denitrificans]
MTDLAPPARSTRRIAAIDIARGTALLAMAIYHFTWDLEFFGYVEPGLTAVGGWKLFARCIASSFLFLVGVSLFLAHANAIRWRPFLIRLAKVAAAAALISIATYIATPGAFIFFGILHQIALASLLGLLFIRAPFWLTLLVAAAVIAAPQLLRSEVFAHPALWWVGLAPTNPRSNDYVPLFPWFGAVLIGIAAAKFATASGLLERLRQAGEPRWSRPLDFLGRHSLAFYLIHQPVLIGLVWIAAQIIPPTPISNEQQFVRACQRTCEQTRDADFCSAYCVCMLDELSDNGLMDGMFNSAQSAEQRETVQNLAAQCTIRTQDALSGGLPK